MSEETQVNQAPVAAVFDQKEIDEGKTFAILSYALGLVGLPFFLVPLIMRNNGFALYHAKQCLMLWIVGMVGGTVCGVLMAVCIGIILLPLFSIGMLVLDILGLVNAVKAEAKPLPVIGKYANDWFKSIVKA